MEKDMRQTMIAARSAYIKALRAALLGPGSEGALPDAANELIHTSPISRYSIGILFPQEHLPCHDSDTALVFDVEKTAGSGVEAVPHHRKGSSEEDGEERLDEALNMSAQYTPSSMGMTFLVRGACSAVRGRVSYATYRRARPTDCLLPCTLPAGYVMAEEYTALVSYDRGVGMLRLKRAITEDEQKALLQKNPAGDAADETLKACLRRLYVCQRQGYVREPHTPPAFTADFSGGQDAVQIPLQTSGTAAVNIVALRKHLGAQLWSVTIMLVNAQHMAEAGAAKPGSCLFQPHLEIDTRQNDFILMDSGSIIDPCGMDEEEDALALLYRHKKSYGTGLGTAVDWAVNAAGHGKIWTDFFPAVQVPPMDFSLPPNGRIEESALSMKHLSDLSAAHKEQQIASLSALVELYAEWIAAQRRQAQTLAPQFTAAAKRHMDECTRACARMRAGLRVLRQNAVAYTAFTLANRAMFMQRLHGAVQAKMAAIRADRYPDDADIAAWLDAVDYRTASDETARWRPFQIAFFLMNIDAVIDSTSPARDLIDLIWFPTGGGKTEAYLGLTAFTIFYRRLAYPKEADGTAVIMRYTLRLLAAQQFTRAATLICACELIRRDMGQTPACASPPLGGAPISIGLWIGGKHTPNRVDGKDGAAEHLDILLNSTPQNVRANKEKHHKFQVLKCPWCGTKLVQDAARDHLIGAWGYRVDAAQKHFSMYCPHPRCPFHDVLPIQVVDEELYRTPPTLLFGTVDKFAMLPWNGKIGAFFATDSANRTPELIIQDELHLISGALGTLVGLFETAVDALCMQKGIAPKIIASTATIRHAKAQCAALYNRDVAQFPPPGLCAEDSFFAKESVLAPERGIYGRIYVGFMPSGKTRTMMEVHTIAALLQYLAAADLPEDVKDKFWTLTVYFNSLKDLGSASSLIADDVMNKMRDIATCLGVPRRPPLRVNELTSRVSMTELGETLDQLERLTYAAENRRQHRYASDLVLATNMISVGIDVARLNVMLMEGQPKLTSEYIQASSRVGRSYPGLVFVQYDAARSRDRSHYEQFCAYHTSFYRFVEPTGATPFSRPARARALHSVLITLLRQREGLMSDASATDFDAHAFADTIADIEAFITKRVEGIKTRLGDGTGADAEELRTEIRAFFDLWQRLVKESQSAASDKTLYFGRRFMREAPKAEERRLLRQYKSEGDDPAIETLTSMRSVDTAARGSVLIGRIPMNEERVSCSLNGDAYTVRAAQAVLRFGPGAMVDFPAQTLVTAAPKYWKKIKPIYDERFARALGVGYFAVPTHITYERFPAWYLCPVCRTFQPLTKWIAAHRKHAAPETLKKDPHMVHRLYCTACNKDLIPARIVTICEKGHLNDFPWVAWVHARAGRTVCAAPQLHLSSKVAGISGLDGLIVSCACGARTSLKGACEPDIFKKLAQTHPGFDFLCAGHHPFRHEKEHCTCHPRTVQRGASSIYFPVLCNSLVIPPYADRLNVRIEQSRTFAALTAEMAQYASDKRTEPAQQKIAAWAWNLAKELHAPRAEIMKILQRKYMSPAKEHSGLPGTSYRYEEYAALIGKMPAGKLSSFGDFSRETMDIAAYGVPHISAISLIDKVRVVNALVGFSRIQPTTGPGSSGFVPIKGKDAHFYPAYEVRGEGIFIALDACAIADWTQRHPILSVRAAGISAHYNETPRGKLCPRTITPAFLMLHTLAHLLIAQLSFSCGYNVASLGERIYYAEEPQEQMSGIFIYTASGDAEGTLGGLVRQGRADAFPRIFRQALRRALVCSNDPVCRTSGGQGRDALNLAACHACALLPETCCEEGNTLLDRSMLIGTYEAPDIGFWRDFC